METWLRVGALTWVLSFAVNVFVLREPGGEAAFGALVAPCYYIVLSGLLHWLAKRSES